MSRPVVRLILDVVLTIAVSLVLLSVYQWAIGGEDWAAAFGEGFRVLFNFMDVGLAIWLILLVVWVVRIRPGGPSAGRTYVSLVLGVILNLLVVISVGFIQGGWAPLLVLFAIQAGIACLLGAAIVVPQVHRLVKNASPSAE